MATEKDIQQKVFKVLKKNVNDETGRGYSLKLIAWVVNGKQLEPLIVHQEIYLSDRGQEMNGKMKGLTAADLFIILENINEVCKIMKIPQDRIAKIVGAENPELVAKAEPF